jgi:hypothetical protein
MAALGVVAGSATPLMAQTPGGAGWRAARHAEDDWMDQVPGQHRFFIDTTSPAGFAEAIFFANNFFTANRTGYGLTNADLAVVICARHGSTPFAYTDAMWAKYGAPLAERAGFAAPQGATPTANPLSANGSGLPSNGSTVPSAIRLGIHFAVCQMATRAYATTVARAIGGDADAIYEDLASHLVENSHLVPAGIVAVNRAQERGYSFAYTG